MRERESNGAIKNKWIHPCNIKLDRISISSDFLAQIKESVERFQHGELPGNGPLQPEAHDYLTIHWAEPMIKKNPKHFPKKIHAQNKKSNGQDPRRRSRLYIT
jgi:hypothetical protein